MNKYSNSILAFLLLFAPMLLNAQLHIENGATLTIENGAVITLQDVDLNNEGTISSGATGKILCTGSAVQTLKTNNATIGELEIDKSSSSAIQLDGDLTLSTALTFTSNDNLLEVDTSDLIFAASASVSGNDDNNFVLTDGDGRVVKNALSTFTYPVGATATTYNPITLTENGTADNIGVKCLPNVLDAGTSGTPLTEEVADVSWELSEEVAGGSNLDITAQWNASDELTDFDRTNSGISHYDATDGWSLLTADLGAAAGSDPYTRTLNGASEMGVYAVGNEVLLHKLRLNIDALLAGAYDAAGEMTDFLRTSSLTSTTTEPFTALGFTHVGAGGGETFDPAILSTTGSGAIVDWVFVEIRTGTGNGTKVATRSALIQADGDIVDVDGTSPLQILGAADGNYYVLVRHRNHLGVLSNATLSLSNSPTSLDFKTTNTNVTGGALALDDLGGGFYGMVSGDFDINGQVQNTDNNGLIPTIGLSGYQQGDFDLNNQVQNTDLQNLLIPNLGKGAQTAY